MGDWTTISVRVEQAERFHEAKAETGDDKVPDLGNTEFLKSLMDAWEENGGSIYGVQLPEPVNFDDVKAAAKAGAREAIEEAQR